MKLILSFLFALAMIIMPRNVYADNVLQLKFDDGGIIKWHIPEDFELSYVTVDTENFRIPMIKLVGKCSEVMIPVETIEWTLRKSENDWIIMQREWSNDWGSVVYEYSLVEKDGKIVIDNLPEDTTVEFCKDYEIYEGKTVSVNGILEIVPTDEYPVARFTSTFVVVNPINL